MIAWMLYSTAIGLLVLLATSAIVPIAKTIGLPARWVWTTAILLALGLSAVAPFRATRVDVVRPPIELPSGLTAAAGGTRGISWIAAIGPRLAAARATFDAVLRTSVAATLPRVGSSADSWVIALWVLLSALVAAIFAAVHIRFLGARRAWPTADLHGVRVRVSPDVGPVVMGVVKPEVVVPRWLLTRAEPDQRLAITHETEHVRARDTAVLALGCVAETLAPWNPVIWMMVSRLRLAVELDCDARVLRRGVGAQSYGALLIDVAEHASVLRFVATALAVDASHLHQRIAAMKPQTSRFAVGRACVAALFGLTAVLAACEAKLPTAAEIDRMDAASAERTMGQLELRKRVDSTITFIVDGKIATALYARALRPDTIAGIEVVGEPREIHITTKPARDASRDIVARDLAAGGRGRGARVGGPGDPVDVAYAQRTGSAPITFIDGVRADSAMAKALKREDIISVEILKGQLAAAMYGAEAENGVITIHTNKAKP